MKRLSEVVRQRSAAMPTRLLVHRTAILQRPRSGLDAGDVAEPMGRPCRSALALCLDVIGFGRPRSDYGRRRDVGRRKLPRVPRLR